MNFINKSFSNQTTNWHALIPASWIFNNQIRCSVGIYKIDKLNLEELNRGFLRIELPTDNLIIIFDGEIESGIFGKNSLKGSFFLIFVNNSPDKNISYNIKTMRFLAGLAAASFGRNIQKQYLDTISLIMDFSDCQVLSASSSDWNHSGEYYGPNLQNDVINFFKEAYSAIEQSSLEQKNKINLSLTWFSEAALDKGVNSFLKFWVSIEILVMKGESIKPIFQTIGNIYGITNDEAKNKFLIGKLFRVRSNIVHHGANSGISFSLLLYIEGIYKDLLFYILDKPSKRYAESILNEMGIEINQSLDKLLK